MITDFAVRLLVGAFLFLVAALVIRWAVNTIWPVVPALIIVLAIAGLLIYVIRGPHGSDY